MEDFLLAKFTKIKVLEKIYDYAVTCSDAFSFFFCTNIEAIDEDLTEVELTTIAEHVDPDILSPLSVRLHKNTKHYMDMMHRFPNSSASDKAFKMLHIWFQDITPSPQNRKRLVDEFCKLKRCRVASAIATKDYSTLK